ncbi:MAG TPA: xanthine dehydrogenase family protein subunit M [Polyangiaceae bacterium]|jgi:xanthine dehydrogenase YagS FAD-binding subunit
MFPFAYVRAEDEERAIAAAQEDGALFVAGGTTLVDLMRLDVVRPRTLVDLTHLRLGAIEANGDGLRIGAMVRNSDLAYHPRIAEGYPVLREALLAGASAQLRNMATVSGNLLQRTRCPYFRDPAVAACNKRAPGSGCAALGGYTRSHAILGGSDHCIAVHPSDMCVALMALDAVVRARGIGGTSRTIPFGEFHVLPGDRPDVESALRRGELVTHVELPRAPFAARSHYVKVRDRASFAFALASAAVALALDGDTIRDARVALGGVATKPWRSLEAEHELVGKKVNAATFQRAAAAAVHGAVARQDNRFKIELAKRTVVRALTELTEAT